MDATQDQEKYAKWEKALDRRLFWKAAYDKAKKDFPKSHPLVKHAKQRLEEADKEYDEIVSEL